MADVSDYAPLRGANPTYVNMKKPRGAKMHRAAFLTTSLCAGGYFFVYVFNQSSTV